MDVWNHVHDVTWQMAHVVKQTLGSNGQSFGHHLGLNFRAFLVEHEILVTHRGMYRSDFAMVYLWYNNVRIIENPLNHWILGWFWVNPIWVYLAASSRLRPGGPSDEIDPSTQFLRVYRASVRSKDPVSVHWSKPDIWRVMFIVLSTKSLFQVWFPQWLAACGITSTPR